MKLDVIPDLPRGWAGGDILLVRGTLPPYATQVPRSRPPGVDPRKFIAHTCLDLERFGEPVELHAVPDNDVLWHAPSYLGDWYLARNLVTAALDSTRLDRVQWKIARPWRQPDVGKAPVVFGLVDHQGVCVAIAGPHRGPDPLSYLDNDEKGRSL